MTKIYTGSELAKYVIVLREAMSDVKLFNELFKYEYVRTKKDTAGEMYVASIHREGSALHVMSVSCSKNSYAMFHEDTLESGIVRIVYSPIHDLYNFYDSDFDIQYNSTTEIVTDCSEEFWFQQSTVLTYWELFHKEFFHTMKKYDAWKVEVNVQEMMQFVNDYQCTFDLLVQDFDWEGAESGLRNIPSRVQKY
jgi:hypothetical protein